MRIKTNTWLLGVMVATISGILHFGSADIPAASPKGILKQAIHWGLSADWLDPATASYSISGDLTLHLFHDALVKAMPDGTYTSCLAESYTISPDTKVYEFKLREGVKFHNGDPFTAEDVAFSFLRYGPLFRVDANRFFAKRTAIGSI